jgi:hypothetical protein
MKKSGGIPTENLNPSQKTYQVYKGFQPGRLVPESYLIKTVGIDCDSKKRECHMTSICFERGWSQQRCLIHAPVEISVSEKRKRRQRTRKKKRYEKLEEIL